MMDNWNFHGFIALPLETMAKSKGLNGYSADNIENGDFFEVMFLILKHEGKERSLFVERYALYLDKPYSAIGQDISKKIYDDFKSIMEAN